MLSLRLEQTLLYRAYQMFGAISINRPGLLKIAAGQY